MHVLVVEDEVELADVFARNLRARGNTATVATTVEGALQEMTREWPDVLVLDVNLPDRSGWDCLRALPASDRRRLGVVVISASSISLKRLDEFGPDAHLEKPFPIEALMRVLDELQSAKLLERGA
jgi:DNA-binding response OmpR family regulator